jgi:hypothetical protein
MNTRIVLASLSAVGLSTATHAIASKQERKASKKDTTGRCCSCLAGAIRTCAALTMLVTLVATPTSVALAGSSQCAPVRPCGDVDDSGEVTTTDALTILRRAVRLVPASELICECAAGDEDCPRELQTCRIDLSACEDDRSSCLAGLFVALESLGECQTERDSCGEDLLNCESALGGCGADLNSCEGSLSTCSLNLTTCENDRAECTGHLATKTDQLTSCLDDLEEATADLLAVTAGLAACSADLEACNATTTTSSTTTTMPPDLLCTLIFGIDNDITLGALQFQVEYGAAPGGFPGERDEVECTNLTPAWGIFNDEESSLTLKAAYASPNQEFIHAPTDVAECTFIARTRPVLRDFSLHVTDAALPDATPLDPSSVEMSLRAIRCGACASDLPACTTTTTNSTTTTTVDSGGGGANYKITWTMVDAVGLGAIQYDTSFAGAPGDFVAKSCTSPILGFPAFGIDNRNNTLGTAIIALTAFGGAGNTTLANCIFTASGQVPVPGDFVVEVTGAADTSAGSYEPLPTVAVAVMPQPQ